MNQLLITDQDFKIKGKKLMITLKASPLPTCDF